jgi:transcriptional regulator with PAS, ATPase and Fis domain
MRRVGSVKERHVNVRLLAATNRDMVVEVQSGRFREDLYYRINVMSLHVPPLREREGDIELLLEKFVGKDWKLDGEALRALEAYRWPGNVRQLINAIERAKIMADDNTIRLYDLPQDITRARTEGHVHQPTSNGDRLDELERTHVLEILTRERGNKAQAARALGINRRSLYRLLEKYQN